VPRNGLSIVRNKARDRGGAWSRVLCFYVMVTSSWLANASTKQQLDLVGVGGILVEPHSKYRLVLAASIPSNRPTAAGERHRWARSRPAA